MLNLFEYTALLYDPDHILTKKELDVLATLLGGMKEIEFILDKQGGDVSIERIKRSLREQGLTSIVYHLESDLKKGNYEYYVIVILSTGPGIYGNKMTKSKGIAVYVAINP